MIERFVPKVEKCAWQCTECGAIARTNLDATSESTGVPCPTKGCFHPNEQTWKRKKDLETRFGKIKERILVFM